MSSPDPSAGSSDDALLLRALRHEPVERPPVWFMRQAGRSLPEYRSLRAERTLMETCLRPEEAAEITLQPVRRHGVDAAILFSDIVTPLHAIGVGVEIRAGVGPVIDEPIRTAGDLARLRDFEPAADMPELADTVALVTRELDRSVPLIGFAGAPFTLASYLVEGGPSKQQSRTKALMLGQPELWDRLLRRLAAIAAQSLRAQVEAGARAVQIFDSWVGTLPRVHYERYVLPVMRELMDELATLGVPRIIFGVATGHLLDLHGATGADCVGVDWRTDLRDARSVVPARCALQGNLDPAALLADPAVLRAETERVMATAPATGHVFNLGHGVLPDTRPDAPTEIVELIHERTRTAAL